MSTDNIVQFSGGQQQQVEAEPVYHYTITLDDDTDHDGVGYLLLNSVFVGVANSESVLHFAYPISRFKGVINHGPVTGPTN